MKRTFLNPASFKASLEQRLRNQALGSSRNVQRRRQLVVYERFLARVFTHLPEAVVLKGGTVLELRLERCRMTKDVDLRMMGPPGEALGRLQAAGRLDLGDHLRFEIVSDPHHPEIEAEGMVYEGLRFRVEARLAGMVYGRPFGLDVAFAEPMAGRPDLMSVTSALEFAGFEPFTIRVYPLETHIAEKLHAYTMPRSRPNSRVKDLPDLALLGMMKPVEAGVLRETIDTTWRHRSTHPVPISVPEPPSPWAPVYLEMARVDALPWATLAEVTEAVRLFLNPVLAGVSGTWDPTNWVWR